MFPVARRGECSEELKGIVSAQIYGLHFAALHRDYDSLEKVDAIEITRATSVMNVTIGANGLTESISQRPPLL